MTKKRVLHIVETLQTGVRSFLLSLSSHQVEQYEVFILWGLRVGDRSEAVAGFDPRVVFIFEDSFHGVLRTVLNPKSYFSVRSVVKTVRPDVVHLHSTAAGFVGRIALHSSAYKMFYTPHCFSFFRKDVSSFVALAFHLAERLLSFSRCVIVACGVSEYKAAQKITSRCALVQNGVDVQTLPSAPSLLSEAFPSVCITGRICKQKNPTVFNQVALRMPDINFIWIGDGELASELLAPNIQVTGWMEREKAVRCVCNSKVFMLPSLWEGLSISLLEAMHLGRVCVVSNSVGNADVIVDNVNGFVCDSVDSYVNAITKGLENPELARRMADQAANDVVVRFSKDRMCQEYDALYDKYISE